MNFGICVLNKSCVTKLEVDVSIYSSPVMDIVVDADLQSKCLKKVGHSF